MKRSLIPSMIFSILILTACLSPRSGGASTPTMASAPSETPSPTATETPSPESLLPQEVKEKFELAGIDLANMQNAKYDKDGLHITLPSGEVIVLTNDQLQKGIYNGQDNVLQYRDEANQNVIYAFDKETSNWGVASLSIENLDAKKWGNYSLIENPDGYYEMKDVQGNLIPEVKLFRDGTAELTYSSKKLAVAFQAISVGAEGQLALGLWDYQNGEWSMAPGYTAEDVRAGEFADDYHKLVVIRGNDEIQKKLTDTIFMARDLYMNNTEGYRPESEFEGITVVTLNGKTIENFDGPAKGWELLWGSEGVHEAGIFYLKPNLNYPSVIVEAGSRDADGAPLQVALGIGYFSVTIINPRYNQEMSVLHVPVVAKEPNKILNLSALVNISDLPRLNPYMENKEVRGKLFIWIVKATQPHLTQYFIADPVLLGFVGEANRSFFSSMPVLPSISFAPEYNSLPRELKSVFFTLLEND